MRSAHQKPSPSRSQRHKQTQNRSSPQRAADDEMQRTEIFLDAFTTGRFSDILIISHNHVYRLHRVMLLQSPFFRRLLLNENGSEVVVVEGSLGIEIGGDWRVTKEGMNISLRDLYTPPHHRNTVITPRNVLSVLPAACFLELESLITHCVRTLLTTLSAETIVGYAAWLERLRPKGNVMPQNLTCTAPIPFLASPYGLKHKYGQLFRDVFVELSEAILGYLCGVVNAGLCRADVYRENVNEELDVTVEDETENQQDPNESPRTNRASGTPSAEKILSRLPLIWVRRVLESDLLCVANEFERYELVKRVVQSRRRHANENNLNDGNIPEFVDVRPDIKKEYEARGEERHDNLVGEDVSVWSEADSSGILEPNGGLLSFVGRSKRGLKENNGETGEQKTADEVTRDAVATEGVFRLRSYFGSLLGKVAGTPSKNDGCKENTLVNRTRKRKRQRIILSDTSSTEQSPQHSDSESDTQTFVEAVEDHSLPVTTTTPPVRSRPGSFTARSPLTTIRRPHLITPKKSHTVDTAFGSGTLPPSAGNVPKEDTILAGIFQTAIIYTYMTFPQLESVKRDGIVPDAVVLESFWLQAELVNHGGGGRRGMMRMGEARFGKFRFAVEFKDVWEYFFGGLYPSVEDGGEVGGCEPKKQVMISELVVCAGLQFRVLLSLGVEEEDEEGGSQDGASGREASVLTVDGEGDGVREKKGKGKERNGEGSQKSKGKGVAKRGYVLRALLQRNRVGQGQEGSGGGTGKRKSSGAATGGTSSSAGGGGGSSAAGTGPGVSYTVRIFNPEDFGSGGERPSDGFIEPVTKCDFDGDGFVKGFGAGLVGGKRTRTDLWAMVVIEFR